MVTSEAGVENVDKTIQLLTDTKPVRVLMAQAMQPFADRNGREGPAKGGRKGPVEEMGVAEMRQELAESHNTIYQLRKNQEPFKRQHDMIGGRGTDRDAGRTSRLQNNRDPRRVSSSRRGLERLARPSRPRPRRFKHICCGPPRRLRIRTKNLIKKGCVSCGPKLIRQPNQSSQNKNQIGKCDGLYDHRDNVDCQGDRS